MDRFWSKVDRRGADDCWEWTAQRKWDYGAFRLNSQSSPIGSHRVAWMLANDQSLTKDQHILHSCNNPPCCNPAHLRVGTHAENMKDTVGRKSVLRPPPRVLQYLAMLDKKSKLEDVHDAAQAYRAAQQDTLDKREQFIDSIMDARDAKATQQEIAEQCVIEPNSDKHLSRQRVAQFMNERKLPE